ncbi:acyl-CoA oxidase [Crossiella equi]|uniref:Acyl-CoA oxidase n=1 Tax=Crossiella equi TaxID=130796 RepID=A0ABS5AT13_9PSEU|nr:acyl-CoA dehydrogenase [Crossiella equi]MBP2479547.1 acyl-CoA oxidase [Crossiella equi]
MSIVDPLSIADFLRGKTHEQAAGLDALLSHPEFADHTASTVEERDRRTYRRLNLVKQHVGGTRAVHGSPELLFGVLEWTAVYDPALFHAALVHFAVCGWTVYELGRPDRHLRELIDELDRGDATGTILITEAGIGSSHIAPATEARFDQETRTFTLHTPGPHATKIMGNVAEAGMPRTSLVYADLVVGSRRCGWFPFAVRTCSGGEHAPGMRVSRLSEVTSIPLDYALVTFDGTRVPFDAWLRDTASISPDGEFTDPIGDPTRRLVRSLGNNASAALGAATGMATAARACVAIAIRFASHRITASKLAPGATVLGYRTHQRALYQALAESYATSVLVRHAQRWLGDGGRADGATTATFAPWTSVHRDLALTKSFATSSLARISAACRLTAGAHGQVVGNRLTCYEGIAQVFQDAAGSNRLNRYDAARELVAERRYQPSVPSSADPADFGSAATAHALVAAMESSLLSGIRRELDAADATVSAFETWNPLLPKAERLADTYLLRLALSCFDEALREVADESVREPLEALRVLFGLTALQENAAWLVGAGLISPADVGDINDAHDRALDRVHPHVPQLVEALDIPAERLRSPIAEEDYLGALLRQSGHE